MTATATKGVWEEQLSSDVKMIFDTNRDPQRITIQRKGDNPTHLEFPDGIREKEVLRARSVAREAYKI